MLHQNKYYSPYVINISVNYNIDYTCIIAIHICNAYVTRNTVFIWPWCFCDQRGVMDDVWCGRANRILVDVISKAKSPWFWYIKSKSSVSPRRNYHFWCFSAIIFDVSQNSPTNASCIVLMWLQRQETPLFWCRKWKNKCFAYAKTHFFVIPHVMYWWMWHSLPDDLATDLDFNMLCIDECGTTCQTTLQRSFTCIEQLTITKDRHSYK